MRHSHPAPLLLLAISLVAGCRRRDDARYVVRDASARPDSLGPGDVRIYNTDSSVDLVLVGDRITAGLSDRVVAEVRRKTDSANVSDSGIGGAIATLVTKTVASAIGTRVEFALDDLNDVRYERGRLVFDWKHGRSNDLFANSRINGGRTDNSFRAVDAVRFVQAVRERKRELGR